jgi:hypothetical protein
MNRYVSTVAVADDETRAGMFGGTAGVAPILDIDLKLREQPCIADEVSIL